LTFGSTNLQENHGKSKDLEVKKKSFPLLPGGSLPCVTLAGLIDGFRAPTAGELSTLLQLLVAYAHGCHWDWAWWSWGVGDGDNYEGSMKVLGP